jgi:hypothetical protein
VILVVAVHDYAELSGLRLQRGRFLTGADDTTCRNYVVLGSVPLISSILKPFQHGSAVEVVVVNPDGGVK